MDGTWKEKKETERRCVIGRKILNSAKSELYLSMRFLDTALNELRLRADEKVQMLGTDGQILYYCPELLIEQYKKGRVNINRAYLHTVFHCLFCHMYSAKKRERTLWELSCDIAAEWVLDGMLAACIHRPPSALRREFFGRLEKEKKVVTAQWVYHFLKEQEFSPESLSRLQREFWADDHRYWGNGKENSDSQQQRERWQEIRGKMQTEVEIFSKEAVREAKNLVEAIQVANRSRYDYRNFLKKFSVLKEEMRVDMDSFDYIFYHYGMEVYGNMPLIEPLETRETKKIEDFVLVLDTSMSCKGDLIRHFLEETYGILSQTESFTRKVNLRVIQCDEKVQSDRQITNQQELADYMREFQIAGEGGTDFRPAFAYVDELIRRKAFSKLRGMIYFTDGYGTFPVKRPAYETAFVFLKEDYRDVDVPPWAIKLILSREELGEKEIYDEY